MSKDLSDPTPVAGEPESFGYRPPRLRITATYDTEGTARPTLLDVEVHDDDALPASLLLLVEGIAAALTKVGVLASPPLTTGTWTTGGAAQIRYTEEVRFPTDGRAA